MSSIPTVEAFENRGWYLSSKGIELIASENEQLKSLDNYIHYAKDMDLGLITSQGFNKKNDKITEVPSPVVLQVVQVRNIAVPSVNQNDTPRLLQVTLTDGTKNKWKAIEIHGPVDCLKLHTPPGTKFLVTKPIPVQDQILLLEPGMLKELGGHVQELVQAWRAGKQFLKRNREENKENGPPVFVPFKIKSNNEKKLPKETEATSGSSKKSRGKKGGNQQEGEEPKRETREPKNPRQKKNRPALPDTKNSVEETADTVTNEKTDEQKKKERPKRNKKNKSVDQPKEGENQLEESSRKPERSSRKNKKEAAEQLEEGEKQVEEPRSRPERSRRNKKKASEQTQNGEEKDMKENTVSAEESKTNDEQPENQPGKPEKRERLSRKAKGSIKNDEGHEKGSTALVEQLKTDGKQDQEQSGKSERREKPSKKTRSLAKKAAQQQPENGIQEDSTKEKADLVIEESENVTETVKLDKSKSERRKKKPKKQTQEITGEENDGIGSVQEEIKSSTKRRPRKEKDAEERGPKGQAEDQYPETRSKRKQKEKRQNGEMKFGGKILNSTEINKENSKDEDSKPMNRNDLRTVKESQSEQTKDVEKPRKQRVSYSNTSRKEFVKPERQQREENNSKRVTRSESTKLANQKSSKEIHSPAEKSQTKAETSPSSSSKTENQYSKTYDYQQQLQQTYNYSTQQGYHVPLQQSPNAQNGYYYQSQPYSMADYSMMVPVYPNAGMPQGMYGYPQADPQQQQYMQPVYYQQTYYGNNGYQPYYNHHSYYNADASNNNSSQK
ncbi:unnamed protein product [Rhizopus stolonifer]